MITNSRKKADDSVDTTVINDSLASLSTEQDVHTKRKFHHLSRGKFGLSPNDLISKVELPQKW